MRFCECEANGAGPASMQTSSPDPTAPNVGGVPQSHNFFHPHFSNHATVLAMSDTFNIGVRPFTSITEENNTDRRGFA